MRKILRNPKKIQVEIPKKCRKCRKRKNFPFPHRHPKTCRNSDKIKKKKNSETQQFCQKFSNFFPPDFVSPW